MRCLIWASVAPMMFIAALPRLGGFNIAFRIPFGWVPMVNYSLGGPVDAGYMGQYNDAVHAALATGAWVIVDCHNYGRWYGGIIGQSGVTNDQFASLWWQVAKQFANEPRVIFGIMNEPHDMPSMAAWQNSVQYAVNSIRSAGTRSQYILLPGNGYTHSSEWISYANAPMLYVTDPIGGGGKSLMLLDVHEYLDYDNSGTHAECTTNNIDLLTRLSKFLADNGRQAILSETGGGLTASCILLLAQQTAYVAQSQTIIGFAIWSAGAFPANYVLSVTPTENVDNALVVNAVRPWLPWK